MKKYLEILRLVIVASVLVGVFGFLPNMGIVSLFVVMGAIILTPVVDRLESMGLNRALVIISLFLLIGTSAAFMGKTLVPIATQEFQNFQKDNYVEQIETRLKHYEELLPQAGNLKGLHIPEKVSLTLKEWLDVIQSQGVNWFQSFLFIGLMVPFLLYFMICYQSQFRRILLNFVPNVFFEKSYRIFARIADETSAYIRAKIVQSTVVTLIVWIGLSVIDFKFSLILGVIAGITNLVPYLGPLMGFIPAFLVGTLTYTIPTPLLIALGIYAFAQLIDTVLIVPFVMARMVSMHPVTVVLAIMVGAQVGGILGMVIAIPLVSIGRVVGQETRFLPA